MKPNLTMKKEELTALATEAGHKVSPNMKKAEILSLLSIRPEALEKTIETIVQAPTQAHWCMNCKKYVRAPKSRPHMICKVRGGVRQPNDGETCIYFEGK